MSRGDIMDTVIGLESRRGRLRATRGRRTIRTILIDADARTFTEVMLELSGDREIDDKRIAALLQCEPSWFGTMSWLDRDAEVGGFSVGDIILAVDGSSPDSDWHGWFELDDQEALEGGGLVIGGDVAAGKRVYYSADVGLAELQSRVKFTRRRMIYGPTDANGQCSCEEIIADDDTA